jgi:predicted nucleic acid-binding protein
MLVLDANVAVWAAAADGGFDLFGRELLVAPPLMWSECRSGLREAVWRGELPADRALAVLTSVEEGPVRPRSPSELWRMAWRLSEELGWAKTYDAEYIALASLLGCRLVTLDGRLKRRTEHLGFVISPEEV